MGTIITFKTLLPIEKVSHEILNIAYSLHPNQIT